MRAPRVKGAKVVNRPTVVVFDVNETLSDMTSIGERLADVGAPADLAPLWFASVLRDGFALTAAGTAETFSRIGQETMRHLLDAADLDRDLEAAVEHVMTGFMSLPLHPDVVHTVRALRQAGLRLGRPTPRVLGLRTTGRIDYGDLCTGTVRQGGAPGGPPRVLKKPAPACCRC